MGWIKFFCVLSVAVFLAVPSVFSLGVSPAIAEIEFTPNGQGEFDVLLMNNRPIPVNIEFESSGLLGDSFTGTEPLIRARGRAVSTIGYDLPEDMPPGRHRQKLTFGEDIPDDGTSGVTAVTSVSMFVYVFKPYPGQHAKAEIRTTNVREGEDMIATVILESKGTEAVFGDVRILVKDADDRLIDTILLDDLHIEGNTDYDRDIVVKSGGYQPGKYTVTIAFDYGAGVAEGANSFVVGQKAVLVNDMTRAFYKDISINKFEVVIESLWNSPLEGVSAEIQLGANVGETPTIELAPFTTKSLVGYWDTDQELPPGEHTAIIRATFAGGEVLTVPFTVTVYDEQETPEEESPTGNVTARAAVQVGLADILFFILCASFIGYFAIRVFAHRKRHE